jgi:hypothetical protein
MYASIKNTFWLSNCKEALSPKTINTEICRNCRLQAFLSPEIVHLKDMCTCICMCTTIWQWNDDGESTYLSSSANGSHLFLQNICPSNFWNTQKIVIKSKNCHKYLFSIQKRVKSQSMTIFWFYNNFLSVPGGKVQNIFEKGPWMLILVKYITGMQNQKLWWW